MIRRSAAALAVVLAACSGSDRVDPAAKTFTYGAAVAPSAAEAAAISAGEASAADGVALQAGTATDEAAAASSIVSLPDQMATEAFSGTSAMALQGSTGTARTVAALGGPTTVTAYGFDDPGCVSIVPGASITYTGCSVTLGTGGIRVDGTLTRSGATLSWDLTSRFTDAGTGYSMNATVHATGALTFGAAAVSGQARSDTHATVTASGVTTSAAFTTLADLALELQRDPLCITGGTLELRRVWTERPAGAPTTGEYADQGLRFTWQGCGTVLVQHGS